MARHFENAIVVHASMASVFDHLDDPMHLSAHMGKASWMMGGGRMSVTVDEGRGRKIGSHIKLAGEAFGVPMSLEEVVTKRDPPTEKQWSTVDARNLLVVGDYTMGFGLIPLGDATRLTIFIDYELPVRHAWLGRLFGTTYAKWCVNKMLADAQNFFVQTRTADMSHAI